MLKELRSENVTFKKRVTSLNRTITTEIIVLSYLQTWTTHAKPHSIHVDMISLGCLCSFTFYLWELFNKWRRCVFIFENCKKIVRIGLHCFVRMILIMKSIHKTELTNFGQTSFYGESQNYLAWKMMLKIKWFSLCKRNMSINKLTWNVNRNLCTSSFTNIPCKCAVNIQRYVTLY